MPPAPSMSQPASVPASLSMIRPNSNNNNGKGIPGWAYFFIVVACISLLLCVGYLFFVIRKQFKSRERSTESYVDESSLCASSGSQSWAKRTPDELYENSSWVKSSASIRSEQSYASKSIGSASYGSRTTREALQQLAERGSGISTITMSNPDQQRGLDPGSGAPSSSRRHYNEEPSNKPRRDPSVFSVTSKSSRHRYYDEEPSIKPKRDPTASMSELKPDTKASIS